MKKIFNELRKKIEEQDNVREEVIRRSRVALKESKNSIYAAHRGDLKVAGSDLSKAKSVIKELKKIHNEEGIYNAALQEYCEAAAYLHYSKTSKLLDYKKIAVGPENYLLGLCDLTGELARKAVFCVVNEKYSEIPMIRKFVSDIFESFTDFSFRNSELRKKSDAIKWNLKKIEEIEYDLKIRDKL